ncbi:uncharacterized protein BDW47DRAFT_22068 [Aspergillus candidus]|uniref:Uncharacterized protein n=1 Tax=Aspergillus candidus TaxID=41067 RepID=A0A2I2FDK0_ASPCN|nr:hypothetical protein BDW47DRAFT_22068 [Aspergillus candidus]PLB38674.1 hypothetical protein BDW47DRAFT_22068 [Aspergillus candidus]
MQWHCWGFRSLSANRRRYLSPRDLVDGGGSAFGLFTLAGQRAINQRRRSSQSQRWIYSGRLGRQWSTMIRFPGGVPLQWASVVSGSHVASFPSLSPSSSLHTHTPLLADQPYLPLSSNPSTPPPLPFCKFSCRFALVIRILVQSCDRDVPGVVQCPGSVGPGAKLGISL